MAAKVIKVAVPQDFAPFGSAGLDLKPQGLRHRHGQFDRQGARREGEIIPVTSANRIPYLQTHKADIVISSLGKNAEREKVIDFSNAYAPFFSGVFGTKDDRGEECRPISKARRSAPRAARSRSKTLSKIGAARRHHQALRG